MELSTINPIKLFTIPLPPKQQSVLWGENLFHHPQSHNLLNQLGTRFFLFTDSSLVSKFSFWIDSLKNLLGTSLEVIPLPFSEEKKNRDTLTAIEETLFTKGIHKQCVILALGGGVVHDVVGFAAATLLRGLPFVMIPTTLLAMCDACFGGKTAINSYGIKNAIGTFYPADLLLLDSCFLDTLPYLQIQEGLAEMIKCALIADPQFFSEMEEALVQKRSSPSTQTLLDWIAKTVTIKMKFVCLDPYDKKERAALNFGHTFAHALEIYSSHTISHGIAVLWGIYFESALSYAKGYLSWEDWMRIEMLMQRLIDLDKLPIKISSQEQVDQFTKLLLRDKKTKILPCFVLLQSIGELKKNDEQMTHPVAINEIQEIMEIQGWVTL